MRNAIALLALAAASAAAQVTGAIQPQQPPDAKKPDASAPAGRARPQPAQRPSSYRDLKYPPLGPIKTPNVATFTLANGIKLYLLEDHELPLVSGTARVRVGNLFDPANKAGLASLTGTVMRTGGTKAKTGEQLDVELENIAASVETGIAETVGSVSFSALKENTDEVMATFHDVLTAPEFRQDKIDLAKSQMRSGISRRNDNPGGIAPREFADIIYGKDTPYGWSVEYATLGRITRADLQNFYQRYFFPSNVMLAVWGDFKTDEMKAKIEKMFGDWTVKQEPVPEFPKVTEKAAAGVYLAVKKDVTQTFVTMGELGGDLRDKDYPALEIMADILGSGFQSRLMQQVRTKMGNAYSVSASWGANYDHPGLFEIETGTKSISTVETIRAIQHEVDRMRTEEVTDGELIAAKETALNSLVFAFDTQTKTLSRILTYEYYGYPKDFIQQYQKGLAAVTRADVLRVAKQRLDPSRFTIVAVGNPDMFDKPLDSLGGRVTPIDLTIPEPKLEVSKADTSSLGRGKQLLERAQIAAGGADKLAEIKDYAQSMEVQLDSSAGGSLIKESQRWLTPSHLRQDSVSPGGNIAVYCDGKAGWVASARSWGALLGNQLKQVQGDLLRLYFRMLLSDSIEGRKVNAVADNTVEISDANGQVVKVTFNAETGLPERASYEVERSGGPPVSVDYEFEDYRDYAGFKLPFKMTITQSGRKFAVATVTEVKINSGLKLDDLVKRP